MKKPRRITSWLRRKVGNIFRPKATTGMLLWARDKPKKRYPNPDREIIAQDHAKHRQEGARAEMERVSGIEDHRHDKYLHSHARAMRRLKWGLMHRANPKPYPYDAPNYRER